MVSAKKEARLRANIISWESGGLGTDIDMLSRVLGSIGCDVWFKGRRYRRSRNRAHSLFMSAQVLLARKWTARSGVAPFDVNFFIESVFPDFLPLARVNCLFPNPEWFRDENLAHVSRLDWILCKTRSGVVAFDDLAVAKRYTGFTSPDRRLPTHERDAPLRCFHLAGASSLKGTEAVVDVWSRHPEWPELIVVRHARRYGNDIAPPLPARPNITYRTDYVADEELRRLQNDCAIHVLPSLAEGYGHAIAEGMSCGALVITTDAPPMNEMVERSRGLLVRVARSEPMRRGTLCVIDHEDLDLQLGRAIAMDQVSRDALRREARRWYEAEAMHFERSLRELISDIEREKAVRRRG